ncbi:MAG: hypothetical protein R3Y07_01535 [Eubacteriales bacterium]
MEQFLILDLDQSTLTTGTLRSPPRGGIFDLEIPEEDSVLLEDAGQLQFIGFTPNTPSFLGEIVRMRTSSISVRNIQRLGHLPEETLQVNHPFESFVYPVTGSWKGRCPISVSTLGCGGINFTSVHILEAREMLEVVVPIKGGDSLLVKGKIVYPTTADTHEESPPYLYKLKFITGVESMETLIRQEVLYRQLKNRKFEHKKKQHVFHEPPHPSH